MKDYRFEIKVPKESRKESVTIERKAKLCIDDDFTMESILTLLPYQDEAFAEYRTKSVQEFRFALSEQTRKQVFYTTFVDNIKNTIKSTAIMDALKELITQQGFHL